MALDKADMNKRTDITRERIFLGAFVKAYSKPVIDANISLNAMSTYLHEIRIVSFYSGCSTGRLISKGTHGPV